jgi:hypothetical protein
VEEKGRPRLYEERNAVFGVAHYGYPRLDSFVKAACEEEGERGQLANWTDRERDPQSKCSFAICNAHKPTNDRIRRCRPSDVCRSRSLCGPVGRTLSNRHLLNLVDRLFENLKRVGIGGHLDGRSGSVDLGGGRGIQGIRQRRNRAVVAATVGFETGFDLTKAFGDFSKTMTRGCYQRERESLPRARRRWRVRLTRRQLQGPLALKEKDGKWRREVDTVQQQSWNWLSVLSWEEHRQGIHTRFHLGDRESRRAASGSEECERVRRDKVTDRVHTFYKDASMLHRTFACKT